MTTAEIAASSADGDGDLPAALRRALAEAAKAMAAHGATPGDIAHVSITARVPAQIHPARTVVDLALREVIGGMRPPIEVRSADHDGVRVALQIRRPAPPSNEAVWRGLTVAEVARAYSTRNGIGDIGAIFDDWRQKGAAYRQAHLTAELAYGTAQGETLDLYMPAPGERPPPLWVFLHGGYWQAVDKAHNAQFAEGMRDAGFAVAMVNYTLAPEAPLRDIVEQVRRATVFLANEAEALGCARDQLHIAGHSAGGHLAAMIACLPEGRLIRSCLGLSGLYDVEPLAHLPMGRMLALDSPAEIAALSPIRHRPQPHVRVGAVVGGLEGSEFHRQSNELAAAWETLPARAIAGKNHFDLLDGLNGGEVLQFALEIAAIV